MDEKESEWFLKGFTSKETPGQRRNIDPGAASKIELFASIEAWLLKRKKIKV